MRDPARPILRSSGTCTDDLPDSSPKVITPRNLQPEPAETEVVKAASDKSSTSQSEEDAYQDRELAFTAAEMERVQTGIVIPNAILPFLSFYP